MLVRIEHLLQLIEKEWFLSILEGIRRLKHELKQLYDNSKLKQVCILTISFSRDNSRDHRFVTHYMLLVYMKEVRHWDTFGRMSIIPIDRNGIDITIIKVEILIIRSKKFIFGDASL